MSFKTKLDRRRMMSALAGGSMMFLFDRRATAQTSATPTTTFNGLQPDGSWSFLDDRGRTISLPALPSKLVTETAVGATLWDFGIQPLGVFGGDLQGQDGKPATIAGRMDLDQVKFAGVDMEVLDLEMIVSLDPDVLLGTTWEPNDPNDFGGYDEAALGGLPAIAPTLAIRVVASPVNIPLERFAELAHALGANLNSPDIVAAKATFDAACDEVRQAAAEKPGLKAMAFYADLDSIYVANPEVASDLMFFADLGVDLVVPETPGADMGGYWEQLSWEQVNKYPVDLFLADDRSFSLSRADLLNVPSFKLLPAATANQIGSWSVEYVISYQGLTSVLQALAASIRAAQVLPK